MLWLQDVVAASCSPLHSSYQILELMRNSTDSRVGVHFNLPVSRGAVSLSDQYQHSSTLQPIPIYVTSTTVQVHVTVEPCAQLIPLVTQVRPTYHRSPQHASLTPLSSDEQRTWRLQIPRDRLLTGRTLHRRCEMAVGMALVGPLPGVLYRQVQARASLELRLPDKLGRCAKAPIA